jgi:DNA polymerase I-like protein with 3'-5' exonuclease and polymerase domains
VEATEPRRPDLSGGPVAFDIETYDPKLDEFGPGVYRKDGKVLGVSLSDGKGFKEYYNLGHYDCGSQERQANLAYLRSREGLGSTNLKVGQRLMYDLDWLENGEHLLKVNGPLASVEIAEAMLDERQRAYNLEFMGKKYFGKGKVRSKPEQFCEQNGLRGDFRKWLHKMPYEVVRDYGAGDADLPIHILGKQMSMLVEQEMGDLFELECELVRCLLLMRKTGTRIDQDKRDRNALKVQNMIEEMEHQLRKEHGDINVRSTQQLAELFGKMGLEIPKTEPKISKKDGKFHGGGNDSINNWFFKRYEDTVPLVKLVHRLRQAHHHLNDFLLGTYVDFLAPDGLIHCSFYNMLTDDYGTKSGRFSSANPNLQQQPSLSKDEFWGKICREVFVPFEADERSPRGYWWGKVDYSQIEYRFMAHFARGRGSDELRAAYNNNPRTDYHQFVQDLTGLTRKPAKNLNFGVSFGMGIKRMANEFGWTVEHAAELRAILFSKAPYIEDTIEAIERVVKARGYIRTFLNRRAHLTDPSKAYTFYNRLVQGSAADLMKKAMLECYRAGLFYILKPHLTVHDEIDVSVPKTREGVQAFREMQHTMETCLTIKVPILAEATYGANWADAEKREVVWKDMEREATA